MITVEFLGTGGAFSSIEQLHNMPLVRFQDKYYDLEYNFLVDCGGDIRHGLKRSGLSVTDIHGIYVSHLHADHIGGLEYVGFARMFQPTHIKPQLFVPTDLVDTLWESLRGGMEYTDDGFVKTLDDYFQVNPMKPGVPSEFQVSGMQIKLTCLEVPHILELNTIHAGASYALTVQYNDSRAFFTTDARYCPDLMMPEYEAADTIFHDCANYPVKGTKGYPTKSLVHARLYDLENLPDKIKAKTWLCHYTYLDGRSTIEAKDAGFLGLVPTGQQLIVGNNGNWR